MAKRSRKITFYYKPRNQQALTQHQGTIPALVNQDFANTDVIDRISDLPDDVLVRILSLVRTEIAITTSLLSRRWKSVWTLLPELDLDFSWFSYRTSFGGWEGRKRRFIEFVEHVFSLHEHKPLQKLRLAFDIVEFDDFDTKASMLVKSAMGMDCLTLDLHFSPSASIYIPEYGEMYNLPPCYFPHPSVTQLKLSSCKFVSSFYRSLTSVSIAKLTTVELQKDSVYDLVSKSPCLEELHLIECKLSSAVFELNVPESNLKCLVVDSCRPNERYSIDLERASIHIPTLLRLKYYGGFTSGYLSICNSENLIEANISIPRYYRPHYEYKLICKLLKNLLNVKSLTLSPSNLEVLNTNGGLSLLSPPYNLKHLTVKLRQVDEEIPGLICLLRSSPYLETLSVNCHPYFETDEEILSAVYNSDEEVVPQPHLLPFEGVSHLMKIKIEEFQGLKSEMEFVKHILQSSLCLKKMTICVHLRYYFLRRRMSKEHYKYFKIKKAETYKSLSALTPAAPDAQILIT